MKKFILRLLGVEQQIQNLERLSEKHASKGRKLQLELSEASNDMRRMKEANKALLEENNQLSTSFDDKAKELEALQGKYDELRGEFQKLLNARSGSDLNVVLMPNHKDVEYDYLAERVKSQVQKYNDLMRLYEMTREELKKTRKAFGTLSNKCKRCKHKESCKNG